jgi:hypothetical protein
VRKGKGKGRSRKSYSHVSTEKGNDPCNLKLLPNDRSQSDGLQKCAQRSMRSKETWDKKRYIAKEYCGNAGLIGHMAN